MIDLDAGCATLTDWARAWEDTEACNRRLYDAFEAGANAVPELRAHRDFVEANDHGYGDRAFHHMWKLIVEELPSEFRFLEIGVFKGQVISLISLLGKLLGKSPEIFGVTPLSMAGDRFSCHADVDYLEAIERIHRVLGLATDRTTLIHGFSQDGPAVQKAAVNAPYDVVYIDGCHELEAVVIDLMLYPAMLRVGGILVVDDASNDLAMPLGLYPGIPDVSLATRELIENDSAFEHLFACGHNRVFRKVKAQSDASTT